MLNNTQRLLDSVVTTFTSPKLNSPTESPTPILTRLSDTPLLYNSTACAGGGGGGVGSGDVANNTSAAAAIALSATAGHALLDTSYSHFSPSLRCNSIQPLFQRPFLDFLAATPLYDMELRDWMQRGVGQRCSGQQQLFSVADESHPLLALAPFSTHSGNFQTTKAHSTNAHSTKASPTVSTPTTDARAPSPQLNDVMLEDCFETKLGRDLLRAALILDSQQQQQPQSHATSSTLPGDGLPVPTLSTDPSPLFQAVATPGLLSPPRSHHHSRHHHHHLMPTNNKHFTAYNPEDRNNNNNATTGHLLGERARIEFQNAQNFRPRGLSPTQRSRSTSEFLVHHNLPQPPLDHHVDIQSSSTSLLARSSPLLSRGLHLSCLDDGAVSIANKQPSSSCTVSDKCFPHLENGYIGMNTEPPTHASSTTTTEMNSSYVSQSHKGSDRCSPRTLTDGEQMVCSEEPYRHYQNPSAIGSHYGGPTFCSVSSPFTGPNRPLTSPLEGSSPSTRRLSDGVTLAGKVESSGTQYESHITPTDRTAFHHPFKPQFRGSSLQKWAGNSENDTTGPFLDFHNLSSILSGETPASGSHTIQHCFRTVDTETCYVRPYHPSGAYGAYTSVVDGDTGTFSSWLSPRLPRSTTTTENSGEFQPNENSLSLLNPNSGPMVQFGGTTSNKGSRRFFDLDNTTGGTSSWRGPTDGCSTPEKHETSSTICDSRCNNHSNHSSSNNSINNINNNTNDITTTTTTTTTNNNNSSSNNNNSSSNNNNSSNNSSSSNSSSNSSNNNKNNNNNNSNNGNTTNTLPLPDGLPLPPFSSVTATTANVCSSGGRSPKEIDLMNTMTATTATPLRYGNESQAAESVQQLVSSASSSSGSSLTEKAGLPSVSFSHLYTPEKFADSCLVTPATTLQPPDSFARAEKDSVLCACDKPTTSSSLPSHYQNCDPALTVESLEVDLVPPTTKTTTITPTALCRHPSFAIREKTGYEDGCPLKQQKAAPPSTTNVVQDPHADTALSSCHTRLSIVEASASGSAPPLPADTSVEKEVSETTAPLMKTVPTMSQTKKLNGARQRIAPLPKEQLVELLAWACVEHSDVAARTEEVVISSPSCRRLMVRNISFLASDSEFRNFMQQFGPIEDCAVVREPDKASRGFGFVTFRDLKDVERLLALPSAQLVFRSRQLFLKLASDPFAEFPDAAAAIPGGSSFTVGSRFSEPTSAPFFSTRQTQHQRGPTTAVAIRNASEDPKARPEAGDCINGIEGHSFVGCDATAGKLEGGSIGGSSTLQSCTSTVLTASTLYTPPSEPFCRREVFLRNLPFNTTEADIRLLLKEDGALAHCRVVNNEKSGTAFGFAIFESWEGAMKAVQQPQRNLDNRSVFLSFASKRTGAKRHYTYHNARQRVLRQQQQQRDILGPHSGAGGNGNGGRSASVFHPIVSYPPRYPC